MKKIFTICCFSVIAFLHQSVAQNTINAGSDTTICLPGQISLNALVNNANATVISDINGTTLADDVFYGQVVPLGFSFTFFGNTYTECLISTNNYITFNTSLGAGSGSPWSITAPIPDPANDQTFNAIMGPWQDLLPNSGGTIRYVTIGTAPNRIFVVEYCSVSMFSCTNLSFSSQIQLHENGSVIETHIIDKPICTTWNTGQAIHGIQNDGGTIAFVNAGRNANVQWQVSNEGTRFQVDPNDPNNYTISNIPFSPVTLGASGIVTWAIAGGAVLGTGTSITVNPTTTTSYVASIDDLCSGFVFYDTVQVIAAPGPNLSFSYPSATVCPGSGNITPTLDPGSIGDFSATPTGLVFVSTTTGEIDVAASALGTYSVSRSGTNSGGCVDTLSVTITITTTPNADQSYASSIYCDGGTPPSPIFATGASPGLFTSTPAGLVFSNVNTGEVDLAASTAGTYTVTNTITGFGCPTTTDTSVVNIAEQTITAGPDLVICNGSTATLNGLVTGPNSGNITWALGTASGTISSPNNDTTNYIPSLNDAGLSAISLIITASGTPTCPTIFDDVALVVQNAATSSAGIDQFICGSVGTSVSLNGTTANSSSSVWTTNGTGSFTNANIVNTSYLPSAADFTAGTVTLYLTATNQVGNCPSAIDSMTIAFGQQSSVTATAQSPSICAGSVINLTSTSVGSVSGLQWTSTGNGSFNDATQANPIYTPSPSDITNGSVTLTLNANAPAPCNTVNSNVNVTIIAIPTATISGGGIVQLGNTVCPNGTFANVNIAINTGTAPYNLTYAVGGDTTTLTGLTTSNFVYPDSIPGPFTIVSLGDNGGCPGTIAGSATIDTVNLRYNAVINDETCGENNGRAFLTGLRGGVSPYNYGWTLLNNNVVIDTDSIITNQLSGAYVITVTETSAGCYIKDTLSIGQVLGLTTTTTADPTTGLFPLTVNFLNNNTSDTLTYAWNFGDNSTSTEPNPTHIFENQGTYLVQLTINNGPGCSISDSLTIVVDGEVPNIFTPNGDGKNDKFSFNRLSVKSFNAQIFNRWGRKVYEWTDPAGGWDGNNVEAGVYYYIVQITSLTDQTEELHGTITLLK